MRWVGLLIMILATVSCGVRRPLDLGTNVTVTKVYDYPGAAEPAVRYVFREDHFTKLSDFIVYKHSAYGCVGQAIHSFYVNGEDYSGSPSSFPSSSDPDDFYPTTHPSFVRSVAVDMTQTFYGDTVADTLQSDACSYRNIQNASYTSPCADFDPDTTPTPAIPTPTVAPGTTPTPAATPAVTPYYPGLRYYRVRDEWCDRQGVVVDNALESTRTHVGGVNIDLDRSQLGQEEDVLLVMTYQALNQNAAWPRTEPLPSGAAPGVDDASTILEVNLIGTGLALDQLISARQPRQWSDYKNASFQNFGSIAHLEDPFGSFRSEQVIIPLSKNALIDRIRIDRVRGSFHLYQVDLYRLGVRK